MSILADEESLPWGNLMKEKYTEWVLLGLLKWFEGKFLLEIEAAR